MWILDYCDLFCCWWSVYLYVVVECDVCEVVVVLEFYEWGCVWLVGLVEGDCDVEVVFEGLVEVWVDCELDEYGEKYF